MLTTWSLFYGTVEYVCIWSMWFKWCMLYIKILQQILHLKNKNHKCSNLI